MTVVQTSKTCVIPQSSSFFSYSGCALIAKPVRSAKCQHIFSFYFFLAFLSKTLLPLGSDLCIFFFFSSDFALVQRPRRSLNSALFCLLFWIFVFVACKLYYITYTFPSLFIIHLKKMTQTWNKRTSNRTAEWCFRLRSAWKTAGPFIIPSSEWVYMKDRSNRFSLLMLRSWKIEPIKELPNLGAHLG